ncbi:MAG: membrane protein insertase YidC [Phycisphaeraceae bacterium]
MAQDQNKSSLLRLVVPLAAALVGVLVILSLMTSPGDQDGTDTGDNDKQAQAQPDKKPKKDDQADADGKPAKDDEDPDDPDPADPDAATADAEDGPGSEPEPSDDKPAAGALVNLRPVFADTVAKPGEPGDLITIGSSDDASGFEVFAEINPYRAGVHRVSLTNEYKDVAGENHYVLLHPIDLSRGETEYPAIGTYAAEYLVINGEKVKLFAKDDKGEWRGHWQVVSNKQDRVTLSLTIQGGPDDAPIDVAKVTRTYALAPGSHTINLDQQVENLTDKTLKVQWQQLAQGDVHHEANDYLRGRSLHYVTGYFDDDYDPGRLSIYVKDGFITRTDLISKLKDRDEKSKWQTVWPNPQVDPQDKQLAWLASENRYFVAISSADVDPDTEETSKITALEAVYPKITTIIYPDEGQDKDLDDEKRTVLLGLTSKERTLKPGEKSKPADLSLDLFVGPREDAIFAQAPYKAMRFERTIRYSLGGFCGFCTFQWLANLLLSFLELLHMAVADWGIAIIILVIVVRICLHPLTKRGQISMMTMGKQMSAIQPELNKLKKKYADDPRQMQQAQMQLFREKGINPAAGALGCLPMFLQMPIWIALYAMLYYAIELRHEPAFYGLFQQIGGWPFLADLSAADRFIPLFADDGGHVLNLLFIRLDYSAINILPILMGVTFYINMKFTTPPPMNEQQATQQKIMRFMPLLFPFFLYSAPAGLTLYICASTAAGILDSYIVRKHVKQLEESGELFKPKQRKAGGFMDRLQKAAEAKAKQIEEAKKHQQPNKGPQNYKKRKR